MQKEERRQHNLSLGSLGEKRAIAFLQEKGYVVLATNFRYKNDEIDIVALDQEYNEVVFVEVKTRTHDEVLGDPSLAVDRRKLEAQARVALIFLRQQKLKNDYRFDVVTINEEKIAHYQNISWLF